MALPSNTTPIYTVTLPSTQEQVRFRPFLVKDQKNLLIAQQSDNQQVMADTLKQVISSCLVDSNLDVGNLATFDMEYLFLQIRGKSVGEQVPLILKCDEDHGEDNKKAQIKYQVNIDDIKVEFSEEHISKFELFDNVGVKMRYPSFEVLDKFNSPQSNDAEVMFNIVGSCIEYVYDPEEIYYAKDQTQEEITQFLENLTTDQFGKIQKFFDTMPKMVHNIEYNCPVCGKHHTVKLEGLQSFF
jgi:hypothetical protein